MMLPHKERIQSLLFSIGHKFSCTFLTPLLIHASDLVIPHFLHRTLVYLRSDA